MDAIQMEPIGKYKADRNGSAKGGAWRSMVENDLDDVAFLGESEKAREAQCEAGSGAVAVCSQRRALCVAALVFAAMFGTALLVAYAGPQPECPCADPRTLVPGRDAAREAGAAPARERVARDGGPFPWRGARLPPHIAPRHYELWLHPNLTTGEMKGEVSIDFKVDRETLFVVVNARDMNITERALFKAGGSFPGPKVARISEYLPADQFYIEFKEKLRRRYNYTLSLRFNSRLERNEKMKGFFVAGTHKSRAAMSRFWLTHARSAFPCFDEPQFKATFKLTIVRDRFHVSLTNMPIVATEEAGFYLGHRLLQDEFAPSPPMSPHMVALCVCALQRRAAPAVALAEGGAPAENVVPAEGGAPATAEPPPPFAPEVSLYTDQRALLDDAEPLLEWVSSTLQQYAWELNTSYPLPKLDIVVVEGGAPYSEGWGLITLAPNMVSDTKTLARLLAQQWFGGLVSPRWWSSQWLLEALTSVLGEQAPPHAYRVAAAPVARRDDDALLLEHTLPALRLDAAGGARPIAAQRLERADIESATDELSLHKGAALVSMALRAAGRVAAREALAALLRTHAHASADARDLWRALEAVAHLPAQAWETWSEQPGYPLVTVTKQGSDILVKQERFMMTAEPPVDEMLMGTELLTRELRLDLEQLMQEPENLTEIYEDENATTTTAPPTTTTKRPKPSKSPPPLKWIIPLTFIVGPPDPEYKAEMENASEAANGTNEWEDRWAENVTHLVWMNETTLTLHWLGRHAWVRFNVGARGVYRCAGLADGAEARSPAERALRLDDAFVLSRARTAPARRALAAVAQLLSERHWAPWRVALAHISAWQPLLVASAAGPAYEQFLAKLPPRGLVMEEPDLDSASDEHLSLRGALLAAGVNWGNEAATGKALKMFDAWYEHNQTIPILYQEAAYRAGVAKRGRDAWTACWRLLLSAPPLAQQDAALAALAGTRNDWLYARFIATLVAQPRASRWLHAAARASCGREGARAALWGAARALPAPRAATLLRDMAPCLHTERDYYEVKYIYGNASLVQSSRNWTQEATTVLETIALNAAWLKQAEPDLLEYFQQEPGI